MLRLFYLSVTGVFGLLRLLPVSDLSIPTNPITRSGVSDHRESEAA